MSQLRKAVNYVGKRPACRTCAEFKPPVVYLTTDSRTAKSNPLCNSHGFTVTPNGVCDKWRAAP